MSGRIVGMVRLGERLAVSLPFLDFCWRICQRSFQVKVTIFQVSAFGQNTCLKGFVSYWYWLSRLSMMEKLLALWWKVFAFLISKNITNTW